MPCRNYARIACLILTLVGVWGCGGRAPRPVPWEMPGDAAITCAAMKAEISSNEQEIARRLPDADQSDRNAVLLGTGLVLIVPFFAMDVRYADRIEIRAFYERNARLRELGGRSGCAFPPPAVKMG